MLGVLALDTDEVESPETVASASARALPYTPSKLVAAPDCGMKYLPRDAAFGKLQALVAGAQLVRAGQGDASAPSRAWTVQAGPNGGMLRKRAGRGSAGSSDLGRDSLCVPDGRTVPSPGPVSRATDHSPGAASRISQCSSADASALSAAARAVASTRVMRQG